MRSHGIIAVLLLLTASNNEATQGPTILRIRRPDGRVDRYPLQNDWKVSDLTHMVPSDQVYFRGERVSDENQSLLSLGVGHGDLIELRNSTKANNKSHDLAKAPSFVPFPHLAKPRRNPKYARSFADLERYRRNLHAVEPQPESSVARVYLCETSMRQFQEQHTKSTGILLGTLHRERKTKRPKTSLSTEIDEYVQSARVQCIWATDSPVFDERMVQIADWLGLRPVGWIFRYAGEREGLPILANELHTASQLQLERMETANATEFVTVALAQATGATEVFQVSDVCLQMVAEDRFQETPAERFLTVRQTVLVDGQETTELDSYLCLVNTAVLQHTGNFPSTTKIKKRGISSKTKSNLLKKMDSVGAFCDFGLVMELTKGMTNEEAHEFCTVLQKYVRGQRKNLQFTEGTKKLLKKILAVHPSM